MLIAANRVGKTYSASQEVTYHATGLYPDWWEGKRFEMPDLIWVASQSNEASRDITQKELLGGFGEKVGTGSIPKDAVKRMTTKQGVSSTYDTVEVVWHDRDGNPTDHVCVIQFKSYEQGWQKFQGTAPEVIWLDEEPYDMKIFTECQTRLLTSKGVLMVTFTPLSGWTSLVQHFYQEDVEGTYIKNVGWSDAPHLLPEDCEKMLKRYPEHERDARSKGIPMLGEGRIFPFQDEYYKCDPFKIPEHFSEILGIDFGIGHPAGTARLAYDRDNDIIYVVYAIKRPNKKASDHARIIKQAGGDKMGDKIPVAWPHDGVNRDKASGKELYKTYLREGVSMLGRSARYNNDTGGRQAQEPVINEMFERIDDGRLKVFSTCGCVFEEMRNFHRKDGLIVNLQDDVIKSIMYAIMMLRFARSKQERSRNGVRSKIGAILK